MVRSWLVLSLLIGACDCGEGKQLTKRHAEAEVDPQSIDFGDVTVGSTELRAVGVRNIGDYALQIENVRISQPEAFSIAQKLPELLEAGAQATLGIEFAPPSAGPWEGTINIETDDTIGTHEVTVRGNGVVAPAACQLTVTPAAVQYPPVQIGASSDQEVLISNASAGECNVSRLEIAGDGAADFSLLAANPGALAPGASATIGVRFVRSTAADPGATFLEIESDDPTNMLRRIPLLVGEQRPGLCVMPTAIHFGVISGSATRDITATACGDHDVSLTALDFTTANPEISMTGAPTLPLVIPIGTSRTITIQYAPTDQTDDRAILTIRSDDALVPSVDVEITGSPDIVPPDVGRFLYYWQIDAASSSNIVRIPLQGGGAAQNYWGQSTGQTGCPGCHQVSRDGRYVAVVEFDIFQTLYVIDTMTDTKITLPLQLLLGSSFSWRPDVGGSPPYQYVVGVNGDLRLGSIGGGYLGPLTGASDPSVDEAMPAWGPDGKIVFVRGQGDANFPGFGFQGPTDLMSVPETGGTATPLAGASGNGYGNYYPAYSPSGRWISFTQSRAGGSTYAAADAQVRLASADGLGTVLDLPIINGNNGATSFPTWSRDGTYLSISSNRTGGVGDWDIYIAPIDEATGMELGAPTNLTTANTPGFEHAAQWSP